MISEEKSNEDDTSYIMNAAAALSSDEEEMDKGDQLWTDKYKPKYISDLMINKKKIDEFISLMTARTDV